MPDNRASRYLARTRFARGLAWLIGSGFLVYLAVSAFRAYPEDDYCLWHSRRCKANTTYAAEFFAELIPGATVLESRRWHTPPYLAGDKEGWFDCTFAIVSLPANAPRAAPVQTQPKFFGWDWPESWGATKARISGGLAPIDLLPECYAYWSKATVATMRSALNDPDSYVLKDFDTLYLYSSKHGIAARVRLGD